MANLNLNPGFDKFTVAGNPNSNHTIEKDIVLGSLFNTSITGAANIFATDLVPNTFPCYIKLYINVSASTIDIILKRTKGGVTKEEILATATANKPFSIEIPVASTGETLNLRTTSGVAYTVNYVSVIETLRYA